MTVYRFLQLCRYDYDSYINIWNQFFRNKQSFIRKAQMLLAGGKVRLREKLFELNKVLT